MAPEHNLFVLLFSMLAINSFNSAKEKKRKLPKSHNGGPKKKKTKTNQWESIKIVRCISIISIAFQPAIQGKSDYSARG